MSTNELPRSHQIAAALGPIALALAALFAGAALYINVAEQPARLALNDEALLAEWRVSFWWAARLQAPLAVATAVAAMLSWRRTGGRLWLIGGVLMIANLPYTLLVMQPVNARLNAPDLVAASARALIEQWGWLHGARTALAMIAVGLFAWALAVQPQRQSAS